MLAVVVHGTAAFALELDATVVGYEVDGLLIDRSAAAFDFAINPVALPIDADDVALTGISFATCKGRRVELAKDILESEIHG
jgi:hypothetical protein